LAFGFSLLALFFLLLVLGLVGFWLFGFWFLAFSIRFTSHFAFGLLAFWLFAFGLCERNEDPINNCPR
jgi:hypothetical protein